jgi:hypothetical protein
MRDIDVVQKAALTQEAVNEEARRLHVSLNVPNEYGDTLLDRAHQSLLLQELTTISEYAENATSEDLLFSEHDEVVSRSNLSVDIKSEVEQAWRADQAAILKARERVVDKVCHKAVLISN